MKLLLDANLSRRMISELNLHFEKCFHVDLIKELEVPAKDTEIWNFARENDLTIVTNDQDFIDLINLRNFPPKVILLRVGNQSREYITNLLIQRKEDIEIFYTSTESGLLEIVAF